jgi:hypothetical protein
VANVEWFYSKGVEAAMDRIGEKKLPEQSEDANIIKAYYKLTNPSPKRNWEKKIALFFLLGVPIGAYLAKYFFFALGNQGAMGPLGLFFLPLFAIILIVAVLIEIIAIAYAVVYRNALPALGFVLLLLLAIFLPPLPFPPSPTEQNFYANRADYEAVVALAKQGPLPKDAPFFAHIEKENPLVVLFNPYNDSYTYVAYAEKRDDLDKTDACYYDGGIHSQIGDTWWLCFREWN